MNLFKPNISKQNINPGIKLTEFNTTNNKKIENIIIENTLVIDASKRNDLFF